MTAEERRAIRDRIGNASPPTDAELDALWEELGTVDAVVLSVMESRWADMLRKPAKYTIEGDSSFDYSENLKLMAKELKDQRASTTGGMTTGRLLSTWDR